MQQDDDGDADHRVRAHFPVFGKIHSIGPFRCEIYLFNSRARLHLNKSNSPNFGAGEASGSFLKKEPKNFCEFGSVPFHALGQNE
jgi:hypothetical protein